MGSSNGTSIQPERLLPGVVFKGGLRGDSTCELTKQCILTGTPIDVFDTFDPAFNHAMFSREVSEGPRFLPF